MTQALLTQPKCEVIMTQVLKTKKDLLEYIEKTKHLHRITAEEGARMDAEMPPCNESAPNPRRLGRMDNLDDLTDEMRKKYNFIAPI